MSGPAERRFAPGGERLRCAEVGSSANSSFALPLSAEPPTLGADARPHVFDAGHGEPGYVGDLRLDDVGLDGMELISEIRVIYDNYDALQTQVLAASIRSQNHVKLSALAGADVATVPPGVLRGLVKHPLTDKGLDAFMSDWKKTGQTIV